MKNYCGSLLIIFINNLNGIAVRHSAGVIIYISNAKLITDIFLTGNFTE